MSKEEEARMLVQTDNETMHTKEIGPRWKIVTTVMVATWIVSAGLAGWLLSDALRYTGIDSFAKVGTWLPVAVASILLVELFMCIFFAKGFRGLFKRATMDLVVARPADNNDGGCCGPIDHGISIGCSDHVQQGAGNCSNLGRRIFGEFHDRVRWPMVLGHLVYAFLMSWYWMVIDTNEPVPSSTNYANLIDESQRVRSFSFLWIAFVPSLVLMLNYKQSATRPRSSSRWFGFSLLVKLFTYATILLLVDPAGGHFFRHDEANSNTELVLLWVFTLLMIAMVMLYWVSYHNCFRKLHDLQFAWVDFPATLCLVMSYVYLLRQRLDDVHAPACIDAQQHPTVCGGHDFLLQASYLIFGAIGILSLPATSTVNGSHQSVSKVTSDAQAAFAIDTDGETDI